jgi:hypothetical protein
MITILIVENLNWSFGKRKSLLTGDSESAKNRRYKNNYDEKNSLNACPGILHNIKTDMPTY